MRNALVVARWELRRTVGRRGFLIFTGFAPLLLVLALVVFSVFGERIGGAVAAASASDAAARYGLVDHAGVFAESVPPPNLLRLADVEAARQAVAEARVAAAFVIPSDYLATGTVEYLAARVGLTREGVEPAQAVIRRALVGALLRGVAAPAVVARVQDPANLAVVELATGAEPAAGSRVVNFAVPYLIAVLFIVAIFVTSGYLLQGVSEEKETRAIEIVLASITPDELLVGKIIGQATAGLLQIVVWVLSVVILAPLLFARLPFPVELALRPSIVPLGIAYFVLGYLLVASLYAAVAAVASTSREGQQLAGYAGLLVVVPLALNFFIIQDPDGLLPVVLSLIPPMAPAAVMIRQAAGSTDVGSTAASLTLLALSVPLAMWLSTRVFRVGLLVYGRRLTLRDIWRALRG